LQGFIRSERDGRQVKKAFAVKLLYQDYGYDAVVDILDVSLGSLSHWRQAYESQGLVGFKPHHKGRKNYLTPDQRETVLHWLQSKDIWTLHELEYHLAETYDVAYESKQSYYDLFDAAGISWEKTSKVNPKADAQAVAAKKADIQHLLARHRQDIEAVILKVLFMDECHLMGGDLEGSVWGKTGQRVEVPIVNELDRQTYYGAVDLLDKQVLLQLQARGNTACTIDYLKFLQSQMPEQRLLILWDGASYHRSHELKDFLPQVNDGLTVDDWRIHCVRFAPNDPTQNPIEDVWLQAKTWLRAQAGWRPTFSGLKTLFELFFTLEIFDSPKIHMYGYFS